MTPRQSPFEGAVVSRLPGRCAGSDALRSGPSVRKSACVRCGFVVAFLVSYPWCGTRYAHGQINPESRVPSSGPFVASPTPRLVTAEPSFDFGRILSTSDLRHIFRVRNAGTIPVKISEIRSSCSAVTASPPDSEIAAGASAEIVVTVRSGEIQGLLDCLIPVYIAGANEPALTLSVRGSRAAPVKVTPPRIAFDEVRGDVPEVRTATIVHSGSQSAEVKIVSMPPAGQFHCEIVPVTPGREYLLWVNTKPPIGERSIHTRVILDTGLPGEAPIEVPIEFTMGTAIEVTPQSLTIEPREKNCSQPAETARRHYVHVRNRGTRPVRLLSAVSDDPAVRIGRIELISGWLYRVEVEVPPGYLPSERSGGVRITTDDPVSPVTVVRIETSVAAPPQKVAENKPAPRRPPAMDMEGKAVPDFSLATLVPGSRISREEVGYWPVTVLNFVAPNCGFCKKQLPKVEQVRAKYEALGVRFVNVSQTMRKAFTAEQAMKEYASVGSNIEIAMDSGNRVGQLFSARSYPTMFIITADGVIQQVIVGAKPNIDALLEERLSALIDGKSPRPVDAPLSPSPEARAPQARPAAAN